MGRSVFFPALVYVPWRVSDAPFSRGSSTLDANENPAYARVVAPMRVS